MRVGGTARVGLATLSALAVVSIAAPAPAQSTTPPPQPRSATARGVHLGTGESIAFALHPDIEQIEVDARSDAPLEVCPSSLDGEGPESGNSSWPPLTGFVACIPFDGSVQLPSTQSALFHLAFLVRGADQRAIDIPRLTITYTPSDGYFEVLPPPIASRGRSPRITVTPTTRRTVGAGATGAADVVAPSGIRTTVTQRGHRVGSTTAAPPGGDSPAYGPVRLDVPVQVVTTNRGDASAQVRIAIAWE